MPSHGVLTQDEILSQPTIWEKAIEYGREQAPEFQGWLASACPTTWFIGCGSSYFAAQAAAAAHQMLTGEEARAVPASELLLFEAACLQPNRRHRCILLSRSGATTEMVRLAARLRDRRDIDLIAITLRPGTPLADIVPRTLLFPDAFDHSVVMTRSFTTLLLLCLVLSLLRARRGAEIDSLLRLGPAGETVLVSSVALAQQIGSFGYHHFVFLGQGPLLGFAQEAALKMKEMALSFAEAAPSLEQRHGPRSIVDEQTLVTVLSSEISQAVEEPLLHELAALGAGGLQISEDAPTAGHHAVRSFHLQSGLPLWQRLPLYILPVQVLALAVARRLQIDCDRPRALSAVVEFTSRNSGL